MDLRSESARFLISFGIGILLVLSFELIARPDGAFDAARGIFGAGIVTH